MTKCEFERRIKRNVFSGSDCLFEILQLRPEPQNDGRLFMNYEFLRSNGNYVDLDRYNSVYTDTLSALGCCQYDGVNGLLDFIYETFNFNKPDDYHHRSVSVSDVIRIKHRGCEPELYFVDSIGYVELEEVWCPNNRFYSKKES